MGYVDADLTSSLNNQLHPIPVQWIKPAVAAHPLKRAVYKVSIILGITILIVALFISKKSIETSKN